MILFIVSCEDLQEVDLGESHVQLNAPSNELVTELTTLTFWWDSISNAQSYNLQIVSKSFTQIEKVILDTTLKKTKVLKKLSLGTYQWRIIARNLNSVAYSDTFSFSIDTAKTSVIRRATLRSRFYEIHGKVINEE
jgi:hypothetical protein